MSPVWHEVCGDQSMVNLILKCCELIPHSALPTFLLPSSSQKHQALPSPPISSSSCCFPLHSSICLSSSSFTFKYLINNASALPLPECSLSQRLQHLRRCNQSKLKTYSGPEIEGVRCRRSAAGSASLSGLRRRNTGCVLIPLLLLFSFISLLAPQIESSSNWNEC